MPCNAARESARMSERERENEREKESAHVDSTGQFRKTTQLVSQEQRSIRVSGEVFTWESYYYLEVVRLARNS